MSIHALFRCFLSLLTLAISSAAFAFPDRPVRIIVPYAAGGAADVLAREMGARLSEVWARPVVIENRPGATGAIGARVVQNAAPDGHTLLVTASAPVVLVPALESRPSEFLTNFTPITTIAAWDLILVSNTTVPASDVKDLLEFAKTSRDNLSYASAGNGAVNHVAGAVFGKLAGINMAHIPYAGDGPGIGDLLAGRVTMSFLSAQVALPLIKAGKLKAMAIAGPSRISMLPEVPTMIEAGLKDFEFRAWIGLFGQRDLPAPLVRDIQEAVRNAMNQDGVRARLQQMGSVTDTSTSSAFYERIQRENAKWRSFVQLTDIKTP